MQSKKYAAIIISLLLAAIIISVSYYYLKTQRTATVLPTYFQYSVSELANIAHLSSEYSISQAELIKWDDISFNLVRSNELGDAYVSRVFAYLYTAMRDVAFITYNHGNEFNVSLDPICSKVLCGFFPKDCPNINANLVSDVYSEALANTVMNKIKERIKYDNEHEQPYLPPDKSDIWVGNVPYFAQTVGHWKTWALKSGQQFRAPPPPSDDIFWNNQLSISKKALGNITEPQKISVVFWAGGPGTITPPGQWIQAANQYMEQKTISLQQQLLIRSVLAIAIADSVIAAFDSKYTYWIKRPFMRDSSIQTVMPTPNHPSYPAGHSVISAAGATILIYYFPNEKEKWLNMQNAASDSRVHGGIHFKVDAEQGLIVGTKVANEVLSTERLNHAQQIQH